MSENKGDIKKRPTITLSLGGKVAPKENLVDKFKERKQTESSHQSSISTGGRNDALSELEQHLQNSIVHSYSSQSVTQTPVSEKSKADPAPKKQPQPVAEKTVESKPKSPKQEVAFVRTSSDEIQEDAQKKKEKQDRILKKVQSLQKMVGADLFDSFDSNEEIESLKHGEVLQSTLAKLEQHEEPMELQETNQEKGNDFFGLRANKKRTTGRKIYKKPKNSAAQKKVAPMVKNIKISGPMSVSQLSHALSVQYSTLSKEMHKLGIQCKSNTIIDIDLLELVITEMGHNVTRVYSSEDIHISQDENENSNIKIRPPVVTVMGHVDHGKTSLLDRLKKTNVVSGEAGSITQHIGAYKVKLGDHDIVFIDTPGHAAFSAIRSRGSQVTDVVILIVAADDGVMPQTLEAFSHAKSADIPIIVAINKIDLPGADIEGVKNSLIANNIIIEESGGDIMCNEISVKDGTGIEELLGNVLLINELHPKRVDFSGNARGVILESYFDKVNGISATLLIQKGQLSTREVLISGQSICRIRTMEDDKGNIIDSAHPGTPVRVYGFEDSPSAGDKFYVVQNEKIGRTIIRERKAHAEFMVSENTENVNKINPLDLMLKKQNAKESYSFIIKGDTFSSVEAIRGLLEKIDAEDRIKIMMASSGYVSEGDISLAQSDNAIILNFNMPLSNEIIALSNKAGIQIKSFDIIYRLSDFVAKMISEQENVEKEKVLIGTAEVRQIFDITKTGKIAGCLVVKGLVKHKADVELIRDGEVFYETSIKMLKYFKENAKEVRQNFECGIQLQGFTDFAVGDQIRVYEAPK